MSDWKTDFERLRECYPTWDALGRSVGVDGKTLRQMKIDGREPTDAQKTAFADERQRIRDEHRIGGDIAVYALQLIEYIREEVELTEQQEIRFEKMEKVLTRKTNKLCE